MSNFIGEGDKYEKARFKGSIVGGRDNINVLKINNFSNVVSARCALSSVFLPPGTDSGRVNWVDRHVAANAAFDSGEVSDQPKCHEGTRIAILDHLMTWATALTYTYSITWVHGPAGSGKSTILRTLAQMLFDQGILSSSFFFFRSSAGRNSVEKFIPSIAYRLALSMPETAPFVAEAILKDPLLPHASLWKQAKVLIVDPIKAAHKKSPLETATYPRIFIIDGLDECECPPDETENKREIREKRQSEILQVLVRILQNLPVPFAAVIASRPERHICTAFNIGDLNRSSSRVPLDNDYQADIDIRKYLTDRFNCIREGHPMREYLPANWPLQSDIHTLVSKASGQFIYASTVDKFVSSSRHNPADRLDIVTRSRNDDSSSPGLDEPFRQLDLLYSSIFLALDPSNLSLTLGILGLFFAFQPLSESCWNFRQTPSFIEKFLNLKRGDVRRLLFDLQAILIVGHDNQTIRIFHASLPDYLFDKSRSHNHWIDTGLVYAKIVEGCLSDDYDRYCLEYIFEQALPTPSLHEAIERYEFNAQAPSLYRTIYMPQLLLRIRNLAAQHALNNRLIRVQKFQDGRLLYSKKLMEYLECVREPLETHLSSSVLKLRLIILAFLDSKELGGKDYMKIFGLPLKWASELDTRLDRGFSEHENPLFLTEKMLHANGMLWGYHPKSTPWFESPAFFVVLRDIFEGSGGKYFIDGNDYADAALYLWNPPPFSDFRYHISASLEKDLSKAFSVFLARASIREDLVQIALNEASIAGYPTPEVSVALRKYRERATSQRPQASNSKYGSMMVQWKTQYQRLSQFIGLKKYTVNPEVTPGRILADLELTHRKIEELVDRDKDA
ncbi:LOW QUALITY PROTEIN: hypothetical protein CVT26_007855 [Gymnopilus dilepis]|uniref:Nephrocystin 3-like N-terminal domain-containing protein n=1 Tax=Gymnopilus dilepis TaxID=231916 RepID=A0A409WTD8_9AGAR|nr:LOW QUALITY PROTEIN: hypothetical protein CVT26_007855 [Gymnopilus dilepis]